MQDIKLFLDGEQSTETPEPEATPETPAEAPAETPAE